MLMLKYVPKAVILSLLSLLGVLAVDSTASAVQIEFNTYAAVAYSNSTGKIGYGWNHRSREAAERAALSECPEPDAKIVGWVKGGWLAIAVSQDNIYGVAWEYGNGASNVVAKKRAFSECEKRNGKVVKVICLCSGNLAPEVIK